jgi:hypothetical protein
MTDFAQYAESHPPATLETGTDLKTGYNPSESYSRRVE